MNKSKIEYCDYSYNPITGCRFNCDFCYAKKICKHYGLYGGSFEPQFHPKQLIPSGSELRPMCPVDVKTPSVIFICDMGDIFSPGMKADWRKQVRAAADAAPWHTYLWLTKNPQYDESWERENWWLGASITGPEDAYKREVVNDGRRWYSYEPLFGVPDVEYLWDAEQVIIGRVTRYKAGWCDVWARQITKHYEERGVPVFWKKNIGIEGPKDLAWRK